GVQVSAFRARDGVPVWSYALGREGSRPATASDEPLGDLPMQGGRLLLLRWLGLDGLDVATGRITAVWPLPERRALRPSEAEAVAAFTRVGGDGGRVLAWVAERNPSRPGLLMSWQGTAAPRWLQAPFGVIDPMVLRGDRGGVLRRTGRAPALSGCALAETGPPGGGESVSEQVAALLASGEGDGEHADLDEFRKIPGAFEELLRLAHSPAALERARAIETLGL